MSSKEASPGAVRGPVHDHVILGIFLPDFFELVSLQEKNQNEDNSTIITPVKVEEETNQKGIGMLQHESVGQK